MKLGILDVAGMIEETIELAPVADALGFHRYWIAEHQPQPTPILIVALVAGLTERIRVGTAGILFHFYAPRRTAYDFHFLERAFAGRIDAGVCRGGVSPVLGEDLEGREMKQVFAAYPERVAKLVHHLRNVPGSEGFDERTTWVGTMSAPPQIWSLGSGTGGDLAARLGLGFGYDLLYRTSKDDPAAINRYRETFTAHWSQPAPRAVVAISGMCAETTETARQYAADYKNEFFAPRIVGDAATCAAGLRAVQARYAADELIFADLTPGLEARKRQLELLAGALDLEPHVVE